MVKKNISVDESPINIIMQGKPKATRPTSEAARISVLTKKSIKEDLQKIAWVQRKTLNQLINSIAESYIQEHQAELKEHDRLKK